MFGFFKKKPLSLKEQYKEHLKGNEHLIDECGIHYAIVSAYGKQATKLKKDQPLAAANKIDSAIQFALEQNDKESISLSFWLRKPAYLYAAGKKGEAFQEIAKLSTYLPPPLEPYKKGTSEWYGAQSAILIARCALLAKDKTTESWVQYISDRILATHYEALFHQQMIKKLSNRPTLLKGSKRNLEFVLRFEDQKDLEKFGWKAFKALKLTHLENELLQMARSWASSQNLGTEDVESWLATVLDKTG